jgi:hypothetical protein
MQARVVLGLALALGGCDREGGNDTGNNDGNVPNILQDAEETEQCRDFNVDGTPIGTATTYWAGEYTFSGTDVTGFEYWYWIPNDLLACQSDDWEPDQACILIWEFFGTKDDAPADCPGCLYTISGSASFRASESDCPPDLEGVEGQDMADLFYKVRDGNGGGVTLYFESDNPVGDGSGNDNGLEWLGPGQCAPVGSSTECE